MVLRIPIHFQPRQSSTRKSRNTPSPSNNANKTKGGKSCFIFAGLAVLCLVYLWFCQPETAGRTYEELDEMFMKGVPAREFKTYTTDAQVKGLQAKEMQHMK